MKHDVQAAPHEQRRRVGPRRPASAQRVDPAVDPQDDFSGGTIGQTNASAERKRIVPAGSYSYGVFIGMQPTRLDDLAGTVTVLHHGRLRIRLP
jgi:hypothetical protein